MLMVNCACAAPPNINDKIVKIRMDKNRWGEFMRYKARCSFCDMKAFLTPVFSAVALHLLGEQ
jgi:hypothetical protein